ncbi:MAG: amidohydrolase family protein, partial [Myxococcota bacterium]
MIVSTLRACMTATTMIAVSTVAAISQDEPSQVLFTNVDIFNGVDETLIEDGSVLVEGNLIKTVSDAAIDAPGATVIDGTGKTLSPGFIELHA